jgi:predicted GNAT family acetyltransferase
MADPEGLVRHDPDHDRWEYVLGGAVVAVLDYRNEGDRVVMHHTYTDPAHRGQGIAALVVQAALDDVRTRGGTVVPACWFVAEFVETHPAYGDLVAG